MDDKPEFATLKIGGNDASSPWSEIASTNMIPSTAMEENIQLREAVRIQSPQPKNSSSCGQLAGDVQF
jgi:hypothetical protein